MIIYMCIIYFNLFIFYSNNLGLEPIRIFIVLQIILLYSLLMFYMHYFLYSAYEHFNVIALYKLCINLMTGSHLYGHVGWL